MSATSMTFCGKNNFVTTSKTSHALSGR